MINPLKQTTMATTHDKDEMLSRMNQNLSQAKSQDYRRLSSYISSHIKLGGFPWFYDTNMCRKSILRRIFSLIKCLNSSLQAFWVLDFEAALDLLGSLVSPLVIVWYDVRANIMFPVHLLSTTCDYFLPHSQRYCQGSFLLLNILNKAVTPEYITVPVLQIYSFISPLEFHVILCSWYFPIIVTSCQQK